MNFEYDNNLFIYIWRLENFRMNAKKKNECISSPKFTIKQFQNSEWCLDLYPKGYSDTEEGTISCFLHFFGPSNNINVYFDIIVINSPYRLPPFAEKDASFLFEKGKSRGFYCVKKADGSELNYPDSSNDIYLICYISMQEKLTANNSAVTELFTSDSLKQELMLPKVSNEIVLCLNNDIKRLQRKYYNFPSKCFAHTIFTSERKSFFCSIDDILNENTSRKSFLIVSATSVPNILITVIINSLKSITVQISLTELNSNAYLFCVCKISFSDSSRKIQYSTESEYCFSSNDLKVWSIELPFKDDNFVNKDQNSICSFPQLFCEIAFSDKKYFSWIEQTQDFSFLSPNLCEREIISPSLQGKMSQLYTSKIFCDVDLCLRGKVFKAHKALLCTSSPVFLAMFQTGMKESEKNEVFIDDLDADTVDRMLKFIYSESLEDINFEAAMKLYEAADKYEIVTLQERCASVIKSNLTTANACPALSLGDTHNDVKLKTAVYSFILENWKEIMALEEWKLFSRENVYLAKDILQDICSKLSHVQIC